jgi:hypothetical protein
MSYERTTTRIAVVFALGLFACALAPTAPAHACENEPGKNGSGIIDAGGLPCAEPSASADAGQDGETARLLTRIVAWLAANFDLPANYDHPRVELISQRRIAALRFGSPTHSGGREVIAVYHDRRRTIYLAEDWTGATPADVSVLVHEMVHHLQNLDRQTFFCPQERERLAYRAQDKWLGLSGSSLAREFDIDPMTLKVSTSCM